jgi:hypothetical protein
MAERATERIAGLVGAIIARTPRGGMCSLYIVHPFVGRGGSSGPAQSRLGLPFQLGMPL